MRSYEDLEAENAELKERLAALIGDWPAVEQYRLMLGVHPQAAKVCVALLKATGWVSTEALYREVFQHENGDGPDIKIVNVVVHNLRKALRKIGAAGQIASAWGYGYTMTPDLRAWLRQAVQPYAVAA